MPSFVVPLVICLWRDAAPCFPPFPPHSLCLCFHLLYSGHITAKRFPSGRKRRMRTIDSQPAGRGVPGHAIHEWREQITPRHCRFERTDSVPQMKSAMKIRRQRIRTTTFAPLSLFLLEAAAAFTAFDRWPVSDLAQKCFGIHRVKDTFLLLLVGSVSE